MDNVFLTGPLGTQWNVGSWVEKSEGVDWGARDLIRQQLTRTTFVEGAQLAYESAAGARKMAFPLIIPSGAVGGLALDTIEASLRQMVRPGGFIDIKPESVPTTEMVRFDILGGGVEHRGYSVDLRRVSRSRYMLTLETQPFGYWPTAIVLASVASVAAGPFTLTVPGASVIGDVPGFGILQIAPFHASGFGGASTLFEPGSWYPDMVAWSLGGKPSFSAFLHPASWTLGGGSLGGDPNAPASQYIGAYLNSGIPWQTSLFNYTIPTPLTPAYTGRFRFFAFIQLGPSSPKPWFAIADNQPGLGGAQALATGNPIATVVPGVAAGTWPWNNVGSGYQLVDLGEIRLPRVPQSGSGPGRETLRIAFSGASSSLASGATGAFLKIGGGYLLPVDAPAGVLAYGLTVPTINTANLQGWTHFLNAQTRENLIFRNLNASGLTPLATGLEIAAAGNISYRGLSPFVSPTINQLTGFVGLRAVGENDFSGGGLFPVAVSPSERTGLSLSYVPRFQFLKGL